MRILLAESDEALALFVSRRLEADGFAIETAAYAERARELVVQKDYHLLILDLNLATADESRLLSEIRASKKEMPILALTVQSRIEERIRLLDLGADDCLVKPFSFLEVAARVRALLRRASGGTQALLIVADLELNRLEHTVARAGRPIELTPKEFLLLEHLMQNAGRPVSRAQILQRVWSNSTESVTNIVDVYVNYLRKKIDEPFQSQLIRTIRGLGYQIGGRGENLSSRVPQIEAGAQAMVAGGH